MSRQVIIYKNGVKKTFSIINRLRIKTPTGGTEEWIPEGDCTLGELYAYKNGLYKPSGDYGFNHVYFELVGGNITIGKNPDDGKLYAINSDCGTVTLTEIPARIAVSTPPTKTAYVDGETIDYTGLVVMLYNMDNTVFTNSDFSDGIIPSSSLFKTVQKAKYGMTEIPVRWVNTYTMHVMTAVFNITVTRS